MVLLDQVQLFLEKTSYQKTEALSVQGDLIPANIHVKGDDFVITVAEGKVTFAPFTPAVRDADGEDYQTPNDYPSPNTARNSLICEVGNKLVPRGCLQGLCGKRQWIPLSTSQ